MSKRSESSFTIDEWNEKHNDEWQLGKLTRTLVTKKFQGSLDGKSEVEAIMLRLNEQDVSVMAYVGIERIECVLDGRSGSFIVLHTAEAIGQDRQATWKILPGSGTGDLAGISGYGTITPGHDFILEYDLPDSVP